MPVLPDRSRVIRMTPCCAALQSNSESITMSGSFDWTLQGFRMDDYRRFMQTTAAFVRDTSLTRAALFEQAGRHLDVLDNPQFEAYNRPDSLAQHPIFYAYPAKREAFSARRFFEAMYRTAEEWNLENGHRFVSAGVCACAQLLSGDSGDDAPACRLAQELSHLAIDVWFLDQFSHREQCPLSSSTCKLLTCDDN